MVYYFLVFGSGNLTATVESLVDGLKPVWAMSVKRKCPYGQVGCVDRARGYKTSVRASKSVWEMSVKSRYPCGRVGLCRLR